MGEVETQVSHSLTGLSKIYNNTTLLTAPKIVMKQGTVTSGTVTFYLTDDGTVDGNALFTTVYSIHTDARRDTDSAILVPFASVKTLSVDLKTLVINVVQGNTLSLLGVLSAIFSPNGTVVNVTVIGE